MNKIYVVSEEKKYRFTVKGCFYQIISGIIGGSIIKEFPERILGNFKA